MKTFIQSKLFVPTQSGKVGSREYWASGTRRIEDASSRGNIKVCKNISEKSFIS